MFDKLKNKTLVLASQSPRRQELIRELGLDFVVRTKDGLDEDYSSSLKVEEIPVFLAEKKAKAFADELKDNEILITADTIVWCNNEVLEKPEDRAHAIEMIGKLSGRAHQVLTGVCIRYGNTKHSFVSTSDVYFKELTDSEIEYYVDNYEPYDKAGAYGIQEWIGYIGIERIDGSFYNVMGLPVQRLYEELKNIENKL